MMTPLDPAIVNLMLFIMAGFVGYYVVWSVTPALHTPLMSLTNAISSVIIVGGIAAIGVGSILGWIAVLIAAINVFGGFVITARMLAMYRKKR